MNITKAFTGSCSLERKLKDLERRVCKLAVLETVQILSRCEPALEAQRTKYNTHTKASYVSETGLQTLILSNIQKQMLKQKLTMKIKFQ